MTARTWRAKCVNVLLQLLAIAVIGVSLTVAITTVLSDTKRTQQPQSSNGGE